MREVKEKTSSSRTSWCVVRVYSLKGKFAVGNVAIGAISGASMELRSTSLIPLAKRKNNNNLEEV